MKKLLLTGLTLVLVVAGATVVLAQGSDPAPTGGGVDVSGPCDEAEHAGDPRCADEETRDDDRGRDGRGDDRGDDRGRDHPEDDGVAVAPPVGDDVPLDISGNCDEAEHAADPECQGVSLSGGEVDDDHGFDDDDGFDDSSGHGGGDDDNSGPGSDDD